MDMEKMLAALEMMQQALGEPEESVEMQEEEEMKPEEEEIQRQAPQPASPAEEELEDKPAEQEEGESEVEKALAKMEAKVMSEIKKATAPDQTEKLMGKMVTMMGTMAKRQEETDEMLGNMLEGFGIADQVQKSWDDSQNKPAEKELTMSEAIVAMGKEIAKGVAAGNKVVQTPVLKSENEQTETPKKVFKDNNTVIAFSQILKEAAR